LYTTYGSTSRQHAGLWSRELANHKTMHFARTTKHATPTLCSGWQRGELPPATSLLGEWKLKIFPQQSNFVLTSD